MPIDFHDAGNRTSYSGRVADGSWRESVIQLVHPSGAAVVDVGCGGGIYTRAWHELGAATVTGVDFSEPMLEQARTEHGGLPGVSFRLGDATATGLTDGSVDLFFARALIHHTPDLRAVAVEAARVLRPGGSVLLQDRTSDDVAQPGSADHLRGWFFEIFPRLLAVENGRRPATEAVTAAVEASGFDTVTTASVWEIRRRYADPEEYLADIGRRTGRSILHELTDPELEHLVGELRRRLPGGPVVERDRWTLWRAERRA